MFDIIYTIFAILTAITTAVFMYRLMMEFDINVLLSAACCVGVGIVAGTLWLPAALVMGMLMFAERKNAYQE